MNRQNLLSLIILLFAFIDSHGQAVRDTSASKLSDSVHPSQMQTVTVVRRKPPIEFHADRMVVNVESSVTNTGATAMEVLKKSPGVTVDQDGNIALKGKQNVVVMLDDKLTYLSGAQLADLLNSLSASQLEQIEIMTNPSSKYDAAGNAGIINIRTKKSRARGFNGNANLSYGQGVHPRYTGGLNLSYRSGKYNFFLNYNHNTENGYEEIQVLRKYLSTDGSKVNEYVRSGNLQQLRNHNNTVKLGMDYYLSPATTLGITATGFRTERVTRGNSTVFVEDSGMQTDSTSYDASAETKTILNGSINLNFQHRIDSARQLSGSLDQVSYRFTDGQHFNNDTYFPDGSVSSLVELRGDLPTRIMIYAGKLDYTQSFSAGLKLEAGWKSSRVRTDNTAAYDNLDNGIWQHDYGKTNHFVYHENINAAYATLHAARGKWNVQTGLRFESTSSHGHQLGNPGKPDSSFNRQYNNLFPTLFISLDASKSHQLTLSTGRRIDRPAYQDLNPFLFYINQYTYRIGNPYIVPQLTNNIELSWIYKGRYSVTANYGHTSNYFNGILRAQHDTTIIMSGNVKKYENAGIAMNASMPLTGWWTAVLGANLNYVVEDAGIENSRIKSAAASGQLNMNNQLHFSKGWTGEVSAFYNTYTVEGQNTSEPYGQVSAGVSRQMGSWVARLTCSNIFLTNNYRGGVEYQDVRVRYVYKEDGRVLSMGLIYRFGKTPKEEKKSYQGDVQEEKRVK